MLISRRMPSSAGRYLVLPVLLVACQFVSTALITPPKDPNEEKNPTAEVRSQEGEEGGKQKGKKTLFLPAL